MVYFDGTNYNDISVPVKGNLRFELPKWGLSFEWNETLNVT